MSATGQLVARMRAVDRAIRHHTSIPTFKPRAIRGGAPAPPPPPTAAASKPVNVSAVVCVVAIALLFVAVLAFSLSKDG